MFPIGNHGESPTPLISRSIKRSIFNGNRSTAEKTCLGNSIRYGEKTQLRGQLCRIFQRLDVDRRGSKNPDGRGQGVPAHLIAATGFSVRRLPARGRPLVADVTHSGTRMLP